MATWMIVVDGRAFDGLMAFIHHNGLIIAEKTLILAKKWSNKYVVLVSGCLCTPSEDLRLNLHVAAVSAIQDVSRGVSLVDY